MRDPAGRPTSKGYPFTRLVTGQTTARLVFSLWLRGERTTAGRRPACSLPACGVKSNQIKSPATGTYSRATTVLCLLRAPQSVSVWRFAAVISRARSLSFEVPFFLGIHTAMLLPHFATYVFAARRSL